MFLTNHKLKTFFAFSRRLSFKAFNCAEGILHVWYNHPNTPTTTPDMLVQIYSIQRTYPTSAAQNLFGFSVSVCFQKDEEKQWLATLYNINYILPFQTSIVEDIKKNSPRSFSEQFY